MRRVSHVMMEEARRSARPMKISRISKIAGASLLGFCAVSLGVDKANLAPVAWQVAGFVGAFLGSMAAQRREFKKQANTSSKTTPLAPPK
jgi:hypothetical protein